MKIFNATPHKITIFKKEQTEEKKEIRKLVVKKGEKPVMEIPSNGILNAKLSYEKFETIDGIDLYKMKILNCDPLPGDYDIIIVSALYASACKALGWDTGRLYTVSQPVYSDSDNPRPVGCLGLNKYE